MKVAGSYASLIRGVSQQAPEVRVAGQHTEQVNMLSDPVAGLTRRRGTIFKSNFLISTSLTYANQLLTADGYRTIEHTSGGKDYVILLRTRPSPYDAANSLPPALCYNITDNLWLYTSWPAGQAAIVTAEGVSAAASIGRYLLFAVNDRPCSVTSADVFGVTANHKPVVYVRGGAYNRVYSVRTPAGVSFSYTTPDAAAGGAAAAIVPSAIAAQLASAATAAGITGVLQSGSHLTFNATFVAGQDISVHDGGDGSLIRGVYAAVDSVDKLPIMGVNGQIIKVQTGPDSWFYVKAFNKGAATLSETIWREDAGATQGVSLNNLGRGRVVGDTLYLGYSEAGNTSGLTHMPAQPEPVPMLVPSVAGDVVTNKAPRWMAGQINYLGLFQDRLLVGSGAELSVSAAGDYLNFFRSTMTTVPVSDGFAMVSQGGEDDTLRWGVDYNRNLVLFGDKRQYLVSGQQALTPTSANMSVMTVYPGAAECRPVAAGGQIFYARNREGSVGVHQIQPGAYVDSAESFPASAQISTYIPASGVELEGVPGAPSLLTVRTTGSARSLYVFSYLDSPDGRKQDAWYRWDFNEKCGRLLSVVNTPSGLLLLWARLAYNADVYVVADLMPLSTALADLPYFDSMRKENTLPTSGGTEVTKTTAGWSVAFDGTTDRFLIGGSLVDDAVSLKAEYPAEAASLWAGLEFESHVTPTNPFARDKDSQALLSGRTVVTGLKVNTRESSGLAWEIAAGGVTTTGNFNGRRMGDPLNAVGTVPISTSIVSVPVGRETREYSLKLKAQRWFPLNLVGIEWTGQSFNRTPRASS